MRAASTESASSSLRRAARPHRRNCRCSTEQLCRLELASATEAEPDYGEADQHRRPGRRLGHRDQLSEESMGLIADARREVERVGVDVRTGRPEIERPQIGHVERIAAHREQAEEIPGWIEDVYESVFVREIADQDVAAEAGETGRRL